MAALVCPACRTSLESTASRDTIAVGDGLRCSTCGAEYPIVSGVPRFVAADNYAQSFGLQWNRFAKTQLDSQSGLPISRNRFFSFTGWTPEELRDKRVLDVGCGAGRFTEIALSCGAHVVAIDYSTAVDACRANLGHHPRLEVLQADIYRLPFKPGFFDYVYCFGVLQHTPNVAAAFRSLAPQLKPGGKLAVDVYPKLKRNMLWPKYWLRPLTRRMPPERLFRAVSWMVRLLWPLSVAIGRVPVIGRKLRYAVPVVNYEGVYGLSGQQLREWALLDTYDMFAPAYDQPQTPDTLRRWFQEAGLEKIEILRSGFLVGLGTAPGTESAG